MAGLLSQKGAYLGHSKENNNNFSWIKGCYRRVGPNNN